MHLNSQSPLTFDGGLPRVRRAELEHEGPDWTVLRRTVHESMEAAGFLQQFHDVRFCSHACGPVPECAIHVPQIPLGSPRGFWLPQRAG